MTAKSDFNAEEWSTIAEAPLLVSMQVAAADRGGTLREGIATARAYRTAREHTGESELLDAIVATPPGLDFSRLQEEGGKVGAVAQHSLREATALVDAKATPEEADAYRDFVLTVAEAAAAAHKEGGFLGIGRTPVSDAERAALDEIRATLGR